MGSAPGTEAVHTTGYLDHHEPAWATSSCPHLGEVTKCSEVLLLILALLLSLALPHAGMVVQCVQNAPAGCQHP